MKDSNSKNKNKDKNKNKNNKDNSQEMRMRKSSVSDKTIEELYQELRSISDRFEREDIDIESSVSEFEKGLSIADEIKKRLSKLENKIEEIAIDR